MFRSMLIQLGVLENSEPEVSEPKETSLTTICNTAEIFEMIAMKLAYNPDLARLSQTSKEFNRIVSESDAGSFAEQLIEPKLSPAKQFLQSSSHFEVLLIAGTIAGAFIGCMGGGIGGATGYFSYFKNDLSVRPAFRPYINHELGSKIYHSFIGASWGMVTGAPVGTIITGGISGGILNGFSSAIKGAFVASPHFIFPLAYNILKGAFYGVYDICTQGSYFAVKQYMKRLDVTVKNTALPYAANLNLFIEQNRVKTKTTAEKNHIKRLLSLPYTKHVENKKSCNLF